MANELLVPRRKIYFTPIEKGRFIPISVDVPDVLKTPMVRSERGTTGGYESGYRSGLIRVDEELYKIKGCRPEGGTHGFEPKGSQTLGLAQFEADNVLKRREVFLREGYDYPLEPIGFWVYDHVRFNGHPNAATIYRAKGDTRMDELLWLIERIPFEYAPEQYTQSIREVLYRAGVQTGKMLRVFHNGGFSWDPTIKRSHFNAHSGNVVVFPDKNAVVADLGIVDFDNSLKQPPSTEGPDFNAIQIVDFAFLLSDLDETDVISTPKRRATYFGTASGHIVGRLLSRSVPGMASEQYGEAGGYLLRSLNPRKVNSLRDDLTLGVVMGYCGKEPECPTLKWDELTSIAKSVNLLRRGFLLEVKKIIGEPITAAKIEEMRKFHLKSLA